MPPRRRSLRLVFALLVGLGMTGLVEQQALAAPPGNDDFDNATAISSLPFSDALDTTQATTASDDPDCSGTGDAHSVWYSFTPSTTVVVIANTFGSDYDTTLSAYTGSRGSLTQIACNDDSGSLQSQIGFTAAGGVTYHLMVASFDGSPGGQLTFSIRQAAPPPANDAFGNATIIHALPFSDAIDTSGATGASSDPQCDGHAHSVWYAFTPGTTVEVVADTFGSDYDTTLSAYKGTLASLTQIACNDDSLENTQSHIIFTATAGVRYHLMAASAFDSVGGMLRLSVRVLPPPVQLGVSIAANGSVNKSGVATIHGNVTCSRAVEGVDISGSLRQQVGQKVTVGFLDPLTVDCPGTVQWSSTVVGETGIYKQGRATAAVSATWFDPDREQTVRATASNTVRLRS
jgi:hypothetical protein